MQDMHSNSKRVEVSVTLVNDHQNLYKFLHELMADEIEDLKKRFTISHNRFRII